MESLLKIKKGIATVLVPGGARESLNGEKDQIRLVLKKRKGFIKLAIKHGVPLVPTFSFGEQRVYDLVGLTNPTPTIIYITDNCQTLVAKPTWKDHIRIQVHFCQDFCHHHH